MKTVASRHNPIVRAFRELALRPDPSGTRLLLDGAHLVRDAVDAGFVLERVCIGSSHLDRDTKEGALARAIERRGIEVIGVSEALLAALSPVRTPSGIVAIATRGRQSPGADVIFQAPDAMAIVAVDVQEPGNVGALLRVAEAAGAAGAVVAGDSASPFSWKALRGSMGSGLRLPILHDRSTANVLDVLRAHQVRTIAAVARGGASPDAVDWAGRVAVMVGGEGPGLSDEIVAGCEVQVTIPMTPPVESLNVAVAAAVLLYAARRQRHTS
jgi:TrmH family RNA methyltransferase